jgi:hypothetical protein
VPIAFVAGFAFYRLDLDKARAWRVRILWVACGLMALARVPGIGVSVNGYLALDRLRLLPPAGVRPRQARAGHRAGGLPRAHAAAHALPNKFPLYQLRDRGPSSSRTAAGSISAKASRSPSASSC